MGILGSYLEILCNMLAFRHTVQPLCHLRVYSVVQWKIFHCLPCSLRPFCESMPNSISYNKLLYVFEATVVEMWHPENTEVPLMSIHLLLTNGIIWRSFKNILFCFVFYILEMLSMFLRDIDYGLSFSPGVRHCDYPKASLVWPLACAELVLKGSSPLWHRQAQTEF